MKKKVMIIMTEDMRAALTRQAARRGANVSGLVRSILGEWLETQGDPVDWIIMWGGNRHELPDAPTPDDAAE